MSTKRKAAMAAVPSLALEKTEQPSPKRRRLPGVLDEKVNAVTEAGLGFLEQLKSARDKRNWAISTHFLTLPNRDELPQYYEQIGLPMALDTIEGKLERREYLDMTSLESDLRRMISNARSFNTKSSQISSDAEKIRKIVQIFMIENNPAYKTPGYQPVATPVPEIWSRPSQKEEDVPEPEADEEGESKSEWEQDEAATGLRSSRRSGRVTETPAVTASNNRKEGSIPAVPSVGGAGEGFEKNTLQQAQDKIITEMMNLTDDKKQLIAANFIQMPPRALTDYYKQIKHPVSLKSIQKLVGGIKGREPPKDKTLLTSWQSFEDEVSFIWVNAREYNEDNSLIVELAEKLRTYFYGRLEEAKAAVPDPPRPKVKLRMHPKSPDPPKITLKFGSQKAAATTGVSVDNEALRRQQELVRAAANSQIPRLANGTARPDVCNVPVTSNSVPDPNISSATKDRPGPGHDQSGLAMNGVKRELSLGQSPALGAPQPNGIGPIQMAPPMLSTPRPPSGSPHPQSAGVGVVAPISHVYTLSANSRLRQPGKNATDALITNLNISTHPDMVTPQPFNLDIPASSNRTQQSLTITLPHTHQYLRIAPVLSPSLMQRPSKTFVTCNNRRQQALPQRELDQTRPLYEHILSAGMNMIEVEVIAGQSRGASKSGSGPDIEIEKFTIFVHFQRA